MGTQDQAAGLDLSPAHLPNWLTWEDTMEARFHLHIVASLLLATLTACGGGGESPATSATITATPAAPPAPPQVPAAPPSPAPAPTSLAPYFLVTGSAGPLVESAAPLFDGFAVITSRHLVVVDPGSPATPALIEPAGQWSPVAQVDEGSVDSATAAVTKLYPRFVVYMKPSGRLHRLDLRRRSWPPAPAVLSKLVSSQLCYGFAYALADLASPQLSILLFVTPGADNQCYSEDDQDVAVRLDMSPEDGPIATGGVVLHALRTDDGAITGYIVRAGDQVRRVDKNFANAVELFAVDRFSFQSAHSVDSRHLVGPSLHFIDRDLLWVLDLSADSGPVTLSALEPMECCLSSAIADAEATYVVISGVDFYQNTGKLGSRILRASADEARALAVEPVRFIGDLYLTPTRIIYSAAAVNEDSFVIRSLPKSGGDPVTILTQPRCLLPQTIVSGEQLWYACQSADDKRVTVVRSDGTDEQVFDNATIVSGARDSSLSLRPSKSTSYSVLIASNLSTGPSVLSGALLQAFDGSSRRPLLTYGVLPSSAFRRAAGLEGVFQPVVGLPGQSLWGLPSLLGAESTEQDFRRPVGRYFDVFYYQSDSAGLTRVTAFVQ